MSKFTTEFTLTTKFRADMPTLEIRTHKQTHCHTGNADTAALALGKFARSLDCYFGHTHAILVGATTVD